MKRILSLVLLASFCTPVFSFPGLGKKDKAAPAQQPQPAKPADYTKYTQAIADAQKEIDDIDANISNRNNAVRQIDIRKDHRQIKTMIEIEQQISGFKKDKAIAEKNLEKAKFKLAYAVDGINAYTTKQAFSLYHKEMGIAAALVATTAGLSYLAYKRYLKKADAKTAQQA